MIITQRAIRRGSFSSGKELIAKIEPFVVAYNTTKAPYNWTATADSILEKLQQLYSQICGTQTRHLSRRGRSLHIQAPNSVDLGSL